MVSRIFRTFVERFTIEGVSRFTCIFKDVETIKKNGYMTTDIEDYKEMMRDARRALESEKDRLTERLESLGFYMKMADSTDELLSQIEELKGLNDDLTEENNQLRGDLREMEMKLSELSKLSVGVARKSSQEEVLKALRIYINISKRKTLSKRVAVKMMIMELANAIGLSFPEDMVAALETLDDEQETEAGVGIRVEQATIGVNSPGNYIANQINK